MKTLRRTQFGNPILRAKARLLTEEEILSKGVQDLIDNMHFTLDQKQYGVGLAAPQVGESLAIAVVGIKPTKTRPELETKRITMINPEIVETFGNRKGMWEACISGSELYGKAMRYKKIQVRWQDEDATQHEETFDGILAQIFQHEIDHLNGILYVDRVKDTKTFITFSEYYKLIKAINNDV